MYSIDWSVFTEPETECVCECGTRFYSHWTRVPSDTNPDETIILTRKPCPNCQKFDNNVIPINP